MNNKELRIGNILKAPLGEISIVKQMGHIDYEDFISCDILDDDGNVCGAGMNSFEPVELTPEILEAAGFRKSKNYNHRYWIVINTYDKTLNIGFYSTGIYPTLIQDAEMAHENVNAIALNNIKYLHQLQNLYQSLCGEELQIDVNKLNK